MLPPGEAHVRSPCIQRPDRIGERQALRRLIGGHCLTVAEAALLVEYGPQPQDERGLFLLQDEVRLQHPKRRSSSPPSRVPLMPPSRAFPIGSLVVVHVSAEGALEQSREIGVHLYKGEPDHVSDAFGPIGALPMAALHVDAPITVNRASEVCECVCIHRQQFTPRPGMKGRFTDEEWAMKEYPA